MMQNSASLARAREARPETRSTTTEDQSGLHSPNLKPAQATAHCPKCGQALPVTRAGVAMSALKPRIFDAIKRTGPDGIECADLYELIFATRGSSRETMKAHVWQLNELIADEGYRIARRGGA